MRLEKGEIHEDIPERCIKTIHQREGDEESQVLVRVLNAEDAEEDSRKNTCRVFPTIDEVRKDILRVPITSDTLQETPSYESVCFALFQSNHCFLPYRWQGGEEAQNPGVIGVTTLRTFPIVRIQAEEQFDVLAAIR